MARRSKITAELVQQVAELASKFVPYNVMAPQLGITPQTLNNWKNKGQLLKQQQAAGEDLTKEQVLFVDLFVALNTAKNKLHGVAWEGVLAGAREGKLPNCRYILECHNWLKEFRTKREITLTEILQALEKAIENKDVEFLRAVAEMYERKKEVKKPLQQLEGRA